MGARMEERVEAGRLQGRQIPLAKSRDVTGRRTFGRAEAKRTALPRKASSETNCARTETDTGRQGEDPKVRGKTLVKELCKLHP